MSKQTFVPSSSPVGRLPSPPHNLPGARLVLHLFRGGDALGWRGGVCGGVVCVWCVCGGVVHGALCYEWNICEWNLS